MAVSGISEVFLQKRFGMLTTPGFIDRLRADQTSGATQLALQALTGLYDYLGLHAELSESDLNALVMTMRAARPSMVPLRNALGRWQVRMAARKNREASLNLAAMTALQQVIDELNRAGDRTAATAAELIEPGATIMIHSRSSTVMRLFRILVQDRLPFDAIVTVSAPGNEGLLMAEELADLSVPTTVITDAQMGLFMPDVDINLSGCDSWLCDGFFLNKSGTYLQALAAKDQSRPFWVLADSFRDSPEDSASVTLEEMAPQAVAGQLDGRIRARNVYFEPVPERLVTGRVTEYGLQPGGGQVRLPSARE